MPLGRRSADGCEGRPGSGRPPLAPRTGGACESESVAAEPPGRLGRAPRPRDLGRCVTAGVDRALRERLVRLVHWMGPAHRVRCLRLMCGVCGEAPSSW